MNWTSGIQASLKVTSNLEWKKEQVLLVHKEAQWELQVTAIGVGQGKFEQAEFIVYALYSARLRQHQLGGKWFF